MMNEELRLKFEEFKKELRQQGKGHEGHSHEAYLQGAIAHLATAESFMNSYLDGIVQEREHAAREQAVDQIRRESEETVRAHNEQVMANRERAEAAHANMAAQRAEQGPTIQEDTTSGN